MYSIEHSSTPILKNLFFKGLAAIALAGITFSASNTPASAVSVIDDNPGSSLPLLGSEGISDDVQEAVAFTLPTGNNYRFTDVALSQKTYFAETDPIVEIVNSTPTGVASVGKNITVSNGFPFTNPTPSFDIDVTQVPEPTLLHEPNTLPGLFVFAGFGLLLCRKNKKEMKV
ncbi:hypothetical protein GTQ43_23310 [Nostoc sp. KVJ3]|uniref:hypothetical protein n=1 Tax=Nostoc sp. KVJ3 TaxID=457945 RepID=UPI002237B708|nr:hypothetical protein [Nostoc sp. KVJ3]MCW5316640.1 hypothetical protein [Nostoc sp. KVJ3]